MKENKEIAVGLEQRMRPLTDKTAKPLIRIYGKMIMELMKQLAGSLLQEESIYGKLPETAVILIAFVSAAIRNWIKNYC